MKKRRKIIATIGTVLALAGGSQVQVNPKPLTVNEWQSLIQVYNYEIGQQGTITVQGFKDFKDLNKEIRKRTPTETVTKDGKPMTPAEYKVERDNLMKKVEKKTVLEVILN